MFQQKLFSLGGFHMKSAGFHLKSTGFHTDFMKSGGFHTDFMKSGGFHEIWRISCEIHPEPYKFRCFSKTLQFGWISHEIRWISPEICQISYGFHEIRWISYGFHVKSKDLLHRIVTLCFQS